MLHSFIFCFLFNYRSLPQSRPWQQAHPISRQHSLPSRFSLPVSRPLHLPLATPKTTPPRLKKKCPKQKPKSKTSSATSASSTVAFSNGQHNCHSRLRDSLPPKPGKRGAIRRSASESRRRTSQTAFNGLMIGVGGAVVVYAAVSALMRR